ncbi:hypothetical protein EHQ23_06890 [Leptospira bourretii]|uniref:Uncharacterized protein n=1 Tax=Leptospira bourretii TaxID=2484962 RepID=A0A4R9IJ75_9LEPT|nr:hypothetical protein [Leptospira bourretii]TGK88545.1 hypothetical protein EHQ23_06890 [Leptospira bourretii]TGK89191.1 hypothetical protein EHQ26_19415 [Leptospira bourretii]TGL29103.1 hypothetical protein EHQ45_15685 [Leptospira bourretii]
MSKKSFLILIFLFQCVTKNNNIFVKSQVVQNKYSERIPIILYFGDSSKLNVSEDTFYIDSWADQNLQIYRADSKNDFFITLRLEEEDIIEDLTFYNAKFYKSEFKAVFIPLLGTIENTDDKIFATGFLRKKTK